MRKNRLNRLEARLSALEKANTMLVTLRNGEERRIPAKAAIECYCELFQALEESRPAKHPALAIFRDVVEVEAGQGHLPLFVAELANMLDEEIAGVW